MRDGGSNSLTTPTKLTTPEAPKPMGSRSRDGAATDDARVQHAQTAGGSPHKPGRRRSLPVCDGRNANSAPTLSTSSEDILRVNEQEERPRTPVLTYNAPPRYKYAQCIPAKPECAEYQGQAAHTRTVSFVSHVRTLYRQAQIARPKKLRLRHAGLSPPAFE